MDLHAYPAWQLAAAFLLGLAATLVLAGWLTPRRWWHRPTAGTLALVGAGTLALGALFLSLFVAPFASRMPPARMATLTAMAPQPAAALHPGAMPPQRYRVIEDLNLRAARATGSPRLAVLRAGTMVTATGAADGDWWRVRARVGGRAVEGWASSLWLRRADEAGVQDQAHRVVADDAVLGRRGGHEAE